MYMYVYIYIYTHTYTYTHTHMHTYIRTYVRTFVYIYIYIYIYIYVMHGMPCVVSISSSTCVMYACDGSFVLCYVLRMHSLAKLRTRGERASCHLVSLFIIVIIISSLVVVVLLLLWRRRQRSCLTSSRGGKAPRIERVCMYVCMCVHIYIYI